MVGLIVLFLAALTTSKVATSFPCSDQQPPSLSSGDDSLPESQKVTTLQYCLVDNCTIMMIDTGEELDVVYTTDSLLVAIPTDGHTSVTISKLENELPCIVPSNKDEHHIVIVVIFVAVTMLVTVMNVYVVVVHLMFKKLRDLMGKLLLLYCLLVAIMTVITQIIHLVLLPDKSLKAACKLLSVIFVVNSAGFEALATCMLHCFAYIMYCSYKLYKIDEEDRKSLFRKYTVFVLGSAFFVFFLMMSYDLGLHQGAHILPNGVVDCNITQDFTSNILIIIIYSHKSIQFPTFLVYLYYKYKINKEVQDPVILSSQEKVLHKIAITMGVTIGIAHVLYMIHFITGSPLVLAVSYLLFCIQQCVIMSRYTCTKKMRVLCKEYFAKRGCHHGLSSNT